MAELQDCIQFFRRTRKELQDEVGVITANIEVLTLDSSSIRPKQLLTRLLVTCINRVKLEVDVPCVLCGRFWVDNAFVCLPCGCLLHLFCIFKVALSTNPWCPFCNHALSSLWRGQWGYATNNDEMHSAIFACSAGMDAMRWIKPLDPIGVRAKVQEALQSLIHEKSQKSAAVKRSSESDNVDLEQPLSKRAHLETDLK